MCWTLTIYGTKQHSERYMQHFNVETCHINMASHQSLHQQGSGIHAKYSDNLIIETVNYVNINPTYIQ
jgi:hypothetical protein